MITAMILVSVLAFSHCIFAAHILSGSLKFTRVSSQALQVSNCLTSFKKESFYEFLVIYFMVISVWFKIF